MHVALLGNAASIHVARWANGLAARGCSVDVVSLTEPGTQEYDRVSVHVLRPRPPFGYIGACHVVRGLVGRLGVDLVHAHYASGYGTLARLVGAPYVLSVWGSDVGEFPRRSVAHLAILRRNVRNALVVCSTSASMAAQLRTIVPGAPRIVLTPFGVDVNNFRPRDGNKIGREFTIGTVRSLRPVYGVDVLMRSFATLRDRVGLRDSGAASNLRLRIVGDGPEITNLRSLAQLLGVAGSVEFVGAVLHSAVADELRQLDLYAQLSREESFGVALLEASASGLPVVASSVGGLPEVVRHRETGFLVPSEAPAEAANAMMYLLDQSSERIRMGNAGRAFVVDNFNWTKSLDIMLDLYESVLCQRPITSWAVGHLAPSKPLAGSGQSDCHCDREGA